MAESDPRYAAHHAGGVIRLEDARRRISVSVSPSAGNIVSAMRINGRAALWFPYGSIDEFKAAGGAYAGLPFLGPWANRLDEQAFYANGRRFAFDMAIGNVRGDYPIHGLLMTADRWQVEEVMADGASAWVTSRLEFFREPLWMKQFPFAHTIEMTHRLRDGALEVATMIENLGTDPMPVAVGFHPYFALTDCPRDEWVVSIGARRHWRLGENKVPTGKTDPIEAVCPDPRAVRVKDHALDHVFDDLVRDDSGTAVMSLRGRTERIDVELGPNYRSMVIYAPKSSSPDGDFACLEPMAGISNSMNLAHRGLYDDLQYIRPGGKWQDSFRIRPHGF